jgi:hypothetical protein
MIGVVLLGVPGVFTTLYRVRLKLQDRNYETAEVGLVLLAAAAFLCSAAWAVGWVIAWFR